MWQMLGTNIGNVSLYDPSVSNSQEPQPGTSKDGKAKRLLTSLCSPPKLSEKRIRKRKVQKAGHNIFTLQAATA